jgi:hypothetical protein
VGLDWDINGVTRACMADSVQEGGDDDSLAPMLREGEKGGNGWGVRSDVQKGEG